MSADRAEPPPFDDATPPWLREGIHGNTVPFVERYYPKLLAWARRTLAQFSLTGQVAAEDIAQDLVRRLLEMPEWTYRPRGRFRDYLAQAVRHRILDEILYLASIVFALRTVSCIRVSAFNHAADDNFRINETRRTDELLNHLPLFGL